MGIFITFEGIEGSGKTTRIKAAADYLKFCGVDFRLTREPGSTELGKKIRAILLDPENTGMDETAELLLYMADRAQHVNRFIKPALASGQVVLCDRYVDATLAYQGYARGLDIGLIKELHRRVLGDLKPDLTFLLDLAPETGLARAWGQVNAGNRSKSETRFEAEALAFHHKVRQGYLELARQEPERFTIIDASESAERVEKEIRTVLELFLKSDKYKFPE